MQHRAQTATRTIAGLHPTLPFLRTALRTLAAAGALLAALLLAEPSSAQAQTDLTTPTGWIYRTNVPVTDIQTDVGNGFRIVDIEVEGVSPFRVSAVLVRNTGDYQKGWWWYYGLTASDVTATLVQNSARAIDVEPYETVVGIRYAVVMIHNTGADYATSHGWQTNHTFSSAVAYRNNNPNRRFIDIQPYMDGGNRRYAFVWVANGGNTYESNWGMLLNTNLDTIRNWLSNSGHRLIDLEIEDDTGNASCLTVPNDNQGWYWFTNVRGSEVGDTYAQYASRIIDYQRYRTAGGAIRYAMVVRPNDNDLAVLAMARQRARLPITARSGFVLREFQGTTSTMAGLFEGRTFAPASTLKTAYHFVAMRQVALGLDDLDNTLTVATGTSGSCPDGTAPVTRTLRETLRRMMENSSNPDTEAIRNRYGDPAILANCAAFGAPDIAINSTIGCACTQNLNEVTLLDLAALHESVIDGALGGYRDDFYDLMSNGDNFGMGTYRTDDVLDEELDASGLDDTEKTLFRLRCDFAHKGGSYTCNPASGPVRQRSRAAYVSLPFRSGCATVNREYFIGSWVNWGEDTADTEDAVGVAITTLYRDRVRAAIESWENASCTQFQVYCTSTPNSSGTDADCFATGSPYLIDNSLAVHGRFLPQNVFAMLLWSEQAGYTPFAGGSQGHLCLDGSIVRFVNSIRNSGTSGSVHLSPSVWSLPTNGGGFTSADPGIPIHFQWWFRDTDGSGAATSNYTSGLRVTFI